MNRCYLYYCGKYATISPGTGELKLISARCVINYKIKTVVSMQYINGWVPPNPLHARCILQRAPASG